MYRGKKISVAMATYNGEKFIREQLESILNQTVLPDEIVVSDDGSKDRTVEIVQEIAGLCNSIHICVYTGNQRHGFAQNFEYAVKRCTGDLVFLCDQDDVWLPEKVAKMASVFAEHNNASCVFHNASSIDADGNPLPTLFNPFIQELAEKHREESCIRVQSEQCCERAASAPLVHGMVMCVSKDLLETSFPFPSSQHDGWLFFCAVVQDKCFFLNEILTLRRCHGENTTGVGKQGFGRNRIRKIMRSIIHYNSGHFSRLNEAMHMKQYVEKHGDSENLGVSKALPTINRVLDIGRKELDAARSGRLSGTIKMLCLYCSDVRYRRSGTKAFLYELADIMLRSKKKRIQSLGDIGI